MHVSAILSLAAAIGFVVATPSPAVIVPDVHGGNGEVVLHTESGCGSSGPLGNGHFIWFIVVGCSPGAEM